MSIQRKLDFLISEDEFEEVIFRFLPKQSHCHSHYKDRPPANWDEVYKVYYSYKVFAREKSSNHVYELFVTNFDECSAIGDVAWTIKHILEGKRSAQTINRNHEYAYYKLLNSEIFSQGDGVSWRINKEKKNRYEVIMWGFSGVGYRFFADKDKLKAFGEFLEYCDEYMLAHGEPI